MTSLRIGVAIVGFISLVFFSPWLTVACMVALSLRYRALEVIAMGALIDILWLPYDSLLYSLPLFTALALLLVWGLEPLRLELLS